MCVVRGGGGGREGVGRLKPALLPQILCHRNHETERILILARMQLSTIQLKSY